MRLMSRSLVGRSPLAHVRLVSRAASSEHAILHVFQQRWCVRDLGSKNGTFVNGKLVTGERRVPLSRGDWLRFGTTEEEWRVESLSAPHVTAPPVEEPLETSALLSSHALADLEIAFVVSPNGEDVELRLRHGEREVSLGHRAYFYLLYVLAQARLADRARGVGREEEGWCACQALIETLKLTMERLNVDVHRARQHLARLGVTDAVDVVQRRKNSATLRLGAPRISIE